jgi:hypothetical protein
LLFRRASLREEKSSLPHSLISKNAEVGKNYPKEFKLLFSLIIIASWQENKPLHFGGWESILGGYLMERRQDCG